MLLTLESFQEEVGRQILKLSRFHSALAMHVLLQWLSVQTIVLVRKLIILKCIVWRWGSQLTCLQNTGSRGCQQNPTCPRVQVSGRKLGNKLHNYGSAASQWSECKRVKEEHHGQGLESDYSTSIIPPEQQDSCQCGGSHKLKIWEVTLDKGLRGTNSMLALLFKITKPVFGSKTMSILWHRGTTL